MSPNQNSADLLRAKVLLKALGKRIKKKSWRQSVCDTESRSNDWGKMKRPFYVTSNDCQGLHVNQRAENLPLWSLDCIMLIRLGMILNCWNENEKKACATLFNWSSSLSVSGWHLSHKKGKITNKNRSKYHICVSIPNSWH